MDGFLIRRLNRILLIFVLSELEIENVQRIDDFADDALGREGFVAVVDAIDVEATTFADDFCPIGRIDIAINGDSFVVSHIFEIDFEPVVTQKATETA